MGDYKAFLFDLNGTIINDMDYHVKAWYGILNELGANISLVRMKQECYGKNNELLERIFPGRFSEEEKTQMSYNKEKIYQQEFSPYLKLVNGLQHFLATAYSRKIKMAIGSSAIMFNVDFVLDGLNIRHYFSSLISADDVTKSKPDPETFLNCASALQVAPADCIVFEDAPKGVEAALNAGMQAVVLNTMHSTDEFNSYPNIICMAIDFNDEKIRQLLN